MYSFYLGIDLHRKKTYAVLIDKAGEVIDERQILNDEAIQYLEEYVPKETFAVLEATRNWPFMYDLLAKHVVRVELANPKELKAISAAAVTPCPGGWCQGNRSHRRQRTGTAGTSELPTNCLCSTKGDQRRAAQGISSTTTYAMQELHPRCAR